MNIFQENCWQNNRCNVMMSLLKKYILINTRTACYYGNDWRIVGWESQTGYKSLAVYLVCSSLYSCNGIQREYYNAKDMSESSICTLYSLPVWWGFFLHFDNWISEVAFYPFSFRKSGQIPVRFIPTVIRTNAAKPLERSFPRRAASRLEL